MEHLLPIIYERFSLSSEEWIIKPRKPKNKGVKANQLIPVLINSGVQGVISNFELNSSTTYRVINNKFPNKPKNKQWKHYLLEEIGYKHCSGCSQYLTLDNYNLDSSTNIGLANKCRNCEKDRGKQSYTKFKEYNPAKTAKYRAAKLRAIPPWANLNKIEEFYINCPVGYHVDHIAPLQGVNISGLHVIENLQYLSSTENQSKANRWDWNTQN